MEWKTRSKRKQGFIDDVWNQSKVFLDTPGVVPDNRHARMNRTLVTSSWRSLDEADHGKKWKETGSRDADEMLMDDIWD